MTKEDKELLLKDLCARLAHGVKVLCLRDFNHECYNLEMVDIGDNEVYLTADEPHIDRYSEIETVKPYLFPMSSMTDEQKEELRLEHEKDNKIMAICMKKCSEGDTSLRGKNILYHAVDWCNKNHFDYRGLIEKGLANDATGKNIY